MIPPIPGLAGVAVFAQAAAADAAQAGGYAVSNGTSISLRSPHLYIVNPASVIGGPGKILFYDALTETLTGQVIPPAAILDQRAVSPSTGS